MKRERDRQTYRERERLPKRKELTDGKNTGIAFLGTLSFKDLAYKKKIYILAMATKTSLAVF